MQYMPNLITNWRPSRLPHHLNRKPTGTQKLGQ